MPLSVCDLQFQNILDFAALVSLSGHILQPEHLVDAIWSSLVIVEVRVGSVLHHLKDLHEELDCVESVIREVLDAGFRDKFGLCRLHF